MTDTASGQKMLHLSFARTFHQLRHFTVASSDAARLIILHLYGGVYLDFDMLLLRDLRPLLLASLSHPFAERWGLHTGYNNALVALKANSSISSYLLRGGTRMGLVFHFMALQSMLMKEGRDDSDTQRGLWKLETGFFDPVWRVVDGGRQGNCTVPCLSDFAAVFRSHTDEYEWSGWQKDQVNGKNRTMQNFFRGAWGFHLHNQVRDFFLLLMPPYHPHTSSASIVDTAHSTVPSYITILIHCT